MAGTARGALVATARRIGVSPVDYAHAIALGGKWCVGCKTFHDCEEFGADASRRDGRADMCRLARKRRYVTPKRHRRRGLEPDGGGLAEGPMGRREHS